MNKILLRGQLNENRLQKLLPRHLIPIKASLTPPSTFSNTKAPLKKLKEKRSEQYILKYITIL